MICLIHGDFKVKTYTVKEIAQLLNISEETVRRWIRSGKLQATMDSRKEGSIITETMLEEFVKVVPKYASILKGSMGGFFVASTALLSTLMLAKMAKDEEIKNPQIAIEEIEKVLQERIKNSKEQIKKKRNSINELEEEIKNEELEINSAQRLLEEIRMTETKNIGRDINE